MAYLQRLFLNRREFLRASGLGAGAGALWGKRAGARPGEPPNILWISCEDTSPDLGCYGDGWARTPNLDGLASQGARFTNAFTVAGVCAPSRSGIITAMYPTTIGTHHMRSKAVPPPYVKCFPEYLRAAGYYCTNNSKTDYNFDSPLSAWDESSTRAHWRNRDRGQPFFAVFNLTVSHESQIRAPDEQFFRQTQELRPEDRHDPAQAKLPPYYPDTPLTRQDWARYYDLVTAMDLRAGRLLRQLEEDGLADNTVVFFWSDHGRGLPRAKRWLYDSGIHVPLLVRWPGRIAPGTLRHDLVSLMDLGPTVLSLAGVEVPRYMQGQAFLGEQARPPRQYVFAARDRMDETYDIIRSVRDRRYKYLRNYQACKPYAQYIDYMEQMPTMREMRRLNKEGKLEGPQKLFFLPEKPPEELYDIIADPHEVRNLAASPEHQEALKRLRAVHEQWRKETNDLGLVPEDELKERMRPGGQWATTAAPLLAPAGGAFAAPLRLRISCPTEGASIAYTSEPDEKPRWKLYSREITLSGSATVRAKACRLGYLDSPEVRADFRIT